MTVLAIGLGPSGSTCFHLHEGMRGLEVLADWRILALAGIAFLTEFFADKIPWVDTAWDAIHTFIRPVGAAILAATGFRRCRFDAADFACAFDRRSRADELFW